MDRLLSPRPNVVLIVADDLGWGDLGSVNGGLSQTPNLDALLGEGTCLSQHFSASPVCAPARAGLLTGRYPHRTGAIDTLEARGLDRIHLGEATLADALGAAGYATGLVGKWHNGALDPRHHPTARGFDEFAGFSGGWTDSWRWRLDVGGSTVPADGRYLTDVLTDHAVDFLRRHRHEPFLLVFASNAPHYPLQAPDEDLAAFADADLPEGVRLVYAMVRALDRGVGRVLDALDDLGLADRTLVAFTSDNGPQLLGVEGHDTRRFACGLRGMKGLVTDGGIRLPVVVRWPDGLPTGRRTLDAPAHLTDWAPTLCELAGAPWPGLPQDGVSLVPLLEGREAEHPPVRFWQWNRYTPTIAGNAAARDGRWKLVVPPAWSALFPTPADLAADHDLKDHPERWQAIDASPLPVHDVEPQPPQLFDVGADPGEEHDLADAHPDVVARLHGELERWFAEVDGERRRLTWA